ncbi:MAG: hypothetical protein CUN55_14850, partial [Phototrophicales bacterium]
YAEAQSLTYNMVWTVPTDISHRIHIIFDTTQLKRVPTSLESFRHTINNKPHPAMGWICMISNNKVQNMIASIITQMMRLNFKVFHSRKEAFRFLVERDPQLADLVPIQEWEES